MRRLVVSDIHGEGHRLVQVLAQAEYTPGNDRLFLLGDYIDRGTNSRLTVQIVQELEQDGAIVLRGNHDMMPLEATIDSSRQHFWETRNGGRETVDSYGGLPPANVIEWLSTRPLYHEEPDCILVHAGLNPAAPLSVQTERDMLWIRGEFHDWYRGKRVFFGHTPTPNLHGQGVRGDALSAPWYGPDKIGIDTGAAYGGPLTLLDIDSGQTWTA